MEGHRELDIAGRAAFGLLILAFGCAAASAASDLERAMELAGSGEWHQARAALLAGARRNPGDKRYPLELAGIEYRRKNPAAAKRYLRRALELDSADRYANDFLGTLYYLEGNLEAALRYWNRIEKPRVDDVKIVPAPRLNPLVVDSALAFAPGSLVTLDGWRTTRARLDGLDVFGNYRLEVRAETEERFDAELGWLRPSAWMTAVSMVRGLAYETVEPELRDIGGSGSNWTSLVRWDAQKRRAATELAGPLMHNAKWRYRWYADARSETWNTGGLEDFRLRKMATGAEFEAIPNGTVTWRSGFEVSSRDLANLTEFRGGTAVTYRAGLTYQVLDTPEKRFTLGSNATWELGRMVSGARDLYSRAQITLTARWMPLARGEDYAVKTRISAGTAQGSTPVDELFLLGIERDNDLWLRGHAGTIEGKKGSEPVGRNYFLANWDIHKEVYRHALFTVEAGPFVDTAKTNDVFGRAGFRRWLVDTGVEGALRLPIGLRATLVYGRDLRGGGRAIYATVGR